MHIYLSPHHDDICFSLGHLASRRGGELLNLFTRSQYVAVAMALPADAGARVEAISRLRREEDLRFVQAAGLGRHDLGLPEPALIGREPFDLTDLDAEIVPLRASLMPYLLDLLSAGTPETATLYCPMGIGGHRNHLTTLLAVRAAYDTLRARCTVLLYEDLHYASVAAARELGLQRAARIFAGFQLAGTALPLDPEASARKMQAIGLYASQHRHPPRIADFTPASGATGLHEIIWRVEPLGGAQA
jgi:hypothetical protein